LPKLEKFDKWMSQSIVSYIAHFKQHNFPQGDALNQTFEIWKTSIDKYREEKGEASTS